MDSNPFLDQILTEFGNDHSIIDSSELDGFLTAIVSGPKMVLPSQWLTKIFVDENNKSINADWKDEAQMERFIEEVMGQFNAISDSLNNESPSIDPIFNYNQLGEDTFTVVEEWCFGYMKGVALGQWPELEGEIASDFDIIKTQGLEENLDQLLEIEIEQRQEMIKKVPGCALKIYQHFAKGRTQTAIPMVEKLSKKAHANQVKQAAVKNKKPGRNDPCICGSGKKYKKCCL